MIDHFVIFHRSGLLLFQHDFVPWVVGRERFVDELIADVFVAQKENVLREWKSAPYVALWACDNGAEVVVVVHQVALSLAAMDDFVAKACQLFCDTDRAVLVRGVDGMLDCEFTFPVETLLRQHVLKPASAQLAAKPLSVPKNGKKGKVGGAPATTQKARMDYSCDVRASNVERAQVAAANIDEWASTASVVQSESSFWSSLQGSFRSVINKTLAEADVAPIADQLKSVLVEKNVAVEVAQQISDATMLGLVGKNISAFSNIRMLVREQMRSVLKKVLNPSEFDLLVAVEKHDAGKGKARPYTIAFCGVNGVGKSTNLAKVAAHLRASGKSVMLAACDTFRSGAIEQLRVHAAALDLSLVSRGYEKEPGAVAKAAIEEASRVGVDVLLIDTAGRMQDNKALMAPLVALLEHNVVDLTLFVGEALVGNEAVDQLRKFKAVIEDGTRGRCSIDGIVLSKFDTVDDKVGAAVSMASITGRPIVFVGVGQTYADLRRLNADVVVDALLG